jgi:Peptidase A4 family
MRATTLWILFFNRKIFLFLTFTGKCRHVSLTYNWNFFRQLRGARRDDFQAMYEENNSLFNQPARKPPRRRRRMIPGRGIGWLITLGAAGGLVVVGYSLTRAGPAQVATSADTSALPASALPGGLRAAGTQQVGGWGKGGYPMMGMPGTATHNAADNATQEASENWAGYAATGAADTFTSVSAAWAQPTVTCSDQDTFSAFWVGLDGAGSDTVEQTGTEADCSGGAATYQGWYEIFPNAPVFYDNPVDPGDAMSASVVSDGGGEFTLTLTDSTQDWTQTTQQSEPDAELASAEVIAEAPSSQSVLPLADFGTVNFSNVEVNQQAIGNATTLDELTMESAGGADLATPSALTDENAFSVTWDSSTGSGSGTGTGTGGGGAGGGGGGHHHHHRQFSGGF